MLGVGDVGCLKCMEHKRYNFEKLEVYELAENLILRVYELLKKFPSEELYGLIAQIKRAVVSIALNIAEGATSRSTKDFIRFVGIALGSLVETKSAFMIARRLSFVSQADTDTLMPYFDELFFKLMALKKSLHEK